MARYDYTFVEVELGSVGALVHGGAGLFVEGVSANWRKFASLEADSFFGKD